MKQKHIMNISGKFQVTIISTIIHKNNETNEKLYQKVAFLMYTEK